MTITSWLITQLTFLAPSTLAGLIGLLLALRCRRRYPTPSTLVFAGCLLFLLANVLESILEFCELLIRYQATQTLTREIHSHVTLVRLYFRVAATTGFGLILTAIFTQRSLSIKRVPSSSAQVVS